MKRKWILLGAVVLPLVLLGAIGATQDAISWKPKLVGTDPDGSCYITWSVDGKSVRVDPTDIRQNLTWASTYFDSNGKRALDNTKVKFVEPRFYLQHNYGDEPLADDADAASVCPNSKQPCHKLKHSEAKYFSIDMPDSTSLVPRYKAWRFSPDERELWIVGAGQLRTWNTSNGQLLRRATLTSKDGIYWATISYDGRLVAAVATHQGEEPATFNIFDAHTGKVRFKVPNAPDYFDFSPAVPVLWTLTKGESYKSPLQISFYDTQTGKPLWKIQKAGYGQPAFSSTQNLVAFPTPEGIELREASTGKIIRLIERPDDNDVVSMVFSPDGSQLWTSQNNGQIWSYRIR